MYATKQEKKVLVLKPHSFTAKIKNTSIFYCSRCGLVPLNNPVTEKEIKKGCYENQNAKDI